MIHDRHEKCLHGDIQLTLSRLRENYWIVNGRHAARRVINSWVTCTRFKGTSMVQQMGNLPKPCVNPSFPFSHVEIDYAVPIRIRSLSVRGHASVKGYIVVFVCFSTKHGGPEMSSTSSTAHSKTF